MTTFVDVTVILVVIALGVLLIHALNGRHDQRIAAFYGDVLPYRPARARISDVPEGPGGGPADSLAGGTREGPQGGSRRRTRTGRSAKTGVGRTHRLLASPRRVTVSDSESPVAGSGQSPPRAPLAEVHIIAASPEAAGRVAEALRHSFAGTEQRSCPAGPEGGARLHLTVDTTHGPQSATGPEDADDAAADAHESAETARE